MQYAASLPFRGDLNKAFALAESALTAIGFRITERTSAALEMVGPGNGSNRQLAVAAFSDRISVLAVNLPSRRTWAARRAPSLRHTVPARPLPIPCYRARGVHRAVRPGDLDVCRCGIDGRDRIALAVSGAADSEEHSPADLPRPRFAACQYGSGW